MGLILGPKQLIYRDGYAGNTLGFKTVQFGPKIKKEQIKLEFRKKLSLKWDKSYYLSLIGRPRGDFIQASQFKDSLSLSSDFSHSPLIGDPSLFYSPFSFNLGLPLVW